MSTALLDLLTNITSVINVANLTAEITGTDSMSPELSMMTCPAIHYFTGFLQIEFLTCLKNLSNTMMSRLHWQDRYLLTFVGFMLCPFVAIFYFAIVGHFIHHVMINRWAHIGALLFYQKIILVHIVGPYILQPMYKTNYECKKRMQVACAMYKRLIAFVSNQYTDYVDAKCNICIANRKDVVLIPCGHTICRECIDFIQDLKCPQCRRNILATNKMYID